MSEVLGNISKFNSLLEVDNLSKSYSRNVAVDNVNFVLNSGEIISILGSNGAGKTSLINVLAGVSKKDSGCVKYKGVNFDKLGQNARKSIGFLMHDSMLYHGLTSFENLQFYGRIFGMTRINDRINEVVEIMGVQELKDVQISKMSHGQRKRFSIARAILMDPEVLLFDEPETGLDSEGVIRLQRVISSMRDKSIGASLIATHNLDFAFSISDKIMVLSKGRLVGINSVHSTSPEHLKEIYSDVLPQGLGNA